LGKETGSSSLELLALQEASAQGAAGSPAPTGSEGDPDGKADSDPGGGWAAVSTPPFW